MLSGSAALVTGASRGIGQAVAAKLAELGAEVATVQRGEGPGVGEAFSLRIDLSDPRRAAAAVEEVADRLGRLDILVPNAGAIDRSPVLDADLETFERIVAFNLTSVFASCQAAARRMIHSGQGGKIVLVSSLLAFTGGLNVSSYSASKGGVSQLAKSLANEWAGKGIRVNAVAPGWTETEFTEALRANKERYAEITGRIPAGRWARPDEIADAVAFLVSPAAEYIHGIVLPVDGGYLAR